jgi:hypothetical protein
MEASRPESIGDTGMIIHHLLNHKSVIKHSTMTEYYLAHHALAARS